MMTTIHFMLRCALATLICAAALRASPSLAAQASGHGPAQGAAAPA